MIQRSHLLRASMVPLVLVAGCKVGPDYVPPEIVVPDAWHSAVTEGVSEGEAALQTWWTTLDDPILEELIQRAGQGNLDLEVAFARMQQARAVRGIVTGERYPDVNGDGFAERARLSESTVEQVPSGTHRTDDFYGLGGSATWEIDVWGRVSRGIEAADARLMASVEDYRDVLVLLFAQIGASYVEVRALQLRIEYAQKNAETQRGSLELTQNRFDAGLVPELDVRQAELNLANTEATIPDLRRQLYVTMHRLAVLLGEPPAELYGLLEEPAPIPEMEDILGAGVPADVVRQRPDVRRAERDLAASTADVGSATAELYPFFTLNGTFGLEATSDLFDAGNRAYSVGPRFVWNLFDGGRVRNNIELQEAEVSEAYASYEQTVLVALEEVENAVVSYLEEVIRRDALQRSVTAAERSVELVQTLYRTGLTDFQNVLDTERFLTVQQDSLAESEGFVVQSVIDLYRALGGGWDPGPEELQEEVRSQEEDGEPIL